MSSSKSPDDTGRPPAQGETTSTDELTAVVEDLLNSLSNKFAGVSSEIFAKMDEMSRRLDNLEAALKANQDSSSNSPSKS
ncbi:heat shock factor binding protein 1-domain-containing protein [Microdochium trichocladiopsis]|uniref:Heat shock factor binding protein 1-domain-containing protein n=1 Tax=Microdochium trichocladiopsis TaxID=1682393 RepID=A0A9P8Y984_9PEZI|nr:heat shock factor binding protein 1-domain-containing protein [Microdochium trichocladiopsis]KAH7033110.1 heat shock factor binding protein 1-domain-containing protein [Microdochium trichocladiopsis]